MARSLLWVVLACALAGCQAVYPELATNVKPAPAGAQLDPPPPEDLRWITFKSGKVPEKTRDGRAWKDVIGSLPDPYAKLFVNGAEILKTSVQSDTLEPTWPEGPRGNFRIDPDAKIRVELWDSNAINDKPVGVRDFGRVTSDQRDLGEIRIELDSGGEVTLAWEKAHAMFGLGLWYELRTDSVFITRMMPDSPAQRAGVQKDDEIMRIGGRNARGMSPDEIRSSFNGISLAGLAVRLRHATGATADTVLREGPIYPVYADFGNVP